ncbi:MAG: hypothetical protein U0T56_01170 [Ferruginibacter sp.]
MQQLEKDKKKLDILLKENEKLKRRMQLVMDKERHRQEMDRIRIQNKVTEDKLRYLRDLERRLKPW